MHVVQNKPRIWNILLMAKGEQAGCVSHTMPYFIPVLPPSSGFADFFTWLTDKSNKTAGE